MNLSETFVILVFISILLAFCITLYEILRLRKRILDYLRINYSAVFNNLFKKNDISSGLVTPPPILWKLIKQDRKLFSAEILLDKTLSDYQKRYKKLFWCILLIIVIYILYTVFIVKIALA